MNRKLYTVNEVKDFISKGYKMVLTADEQILKQLPKGNWIGGTTPYFMDMDKGVFTKEQVFVDDFTSIAKDFKIEEFSAHNIKNIALNSFENGFSVLVLPSENDVFYEFANNSLSYENIFQNPIVGFVAGADFDDLDNVTTKAINGQTGEMADDKAFVIHISLPKNKIARTEILNLDTIQPDSDKIEFPKTSFVQSDCLINGKKRNIAEYLTDIKYKEKAPRPLIANINGALINRDIKEINTETKEVTFFSTVFEGDSYYLTTIIDDYQSLFNERLKEFKNNPIYTSICVSYYLLGGLENKKINVKGAFAFGEIAFQLLNKTLVLLEIDEV
jgi:hypothetical protein